MNDSALECEPTAWPAKRNDWFRFLAGFAIVFALFQVLAFVLKSFRGEWGVPIAAVILGSLAFYAAAAFRESLERAFRLIGLGRPNWKGLGVAALLSLAMIAAVPMTLGSAWSFYPNSAMLAIGVLFQAGIAEEALFRAYLFGRLRPGRTFWGAAGISMIPFVFAHLFLLFTMELSIAVASIVLSVLTAFPLARLYERGGNTVWAPAILHAVIQGTPKLVVPDEAGMTFPLVWMAVCAAVPYGVFFLRKGVLKGGSSGVALDAGDAINRTDTT